MNKIAEQKALEKYPFEPIECGGGIADSNSEYRGLYQEGYDQAMQDFMEKAEEYLRNEFEDMGIRYIRGCSVDEEIEMFKNYMQDESEN